MSIRERVVADLTAAMKAKDAERTSALRLVRAELLNLEKAGAGPPDDAAVQKALQRLLKQRREAAEQYEQAGRADQARRERAEAALIEAYLPAALTEAELLALVEATLAETGAAAPGDLGRVMGRLMARVKATGKTADGAALNALVRAKLGG